MRGMNGCVVNIFSTQAIWFLWQRIKDQKNKLMKEYTTEESTDTQTHKRHAHTHTYTRTHNVKLLQQETTKA
jgi:ABC-type nickel/cobalt efflux system permease component RcnA